MGRIGENEQSKPADVYSGMDFGTRDRYRHAVEFPPGTSYCSIEHLCGDDHHAEAAWKIADPILNAWENNPPKNFPNYAAGTWAVRSGATVTARQPSLVDNLDSKKSN